MLKLEFTNQELDLIKWIDSEVKNYDTCGEYNYCANCNKEKAYPCAYAYETFYNAYKASNSLTKTTKKTIKTTTTKKAATAKKTTTAKKTATAKKTTTKRTTKVAA